MEGSIIEILGYRLKSKSELGIDSKDKKKAFLTEMEEQNISNYLANCKAILHEVYLGRLELEEYLIQNHRPLLNRKGNKG